MTATAPRRAGDDRVRLGRPAGSCEPGKVAQRRSPAGGRAWKSALQAASAFVLVALSWARVCDAHAEALAAEPWLRIEAQGDGCIAASTLRREIERLLDGRRPARVSVSARESDRGWIIVLAHADGQRAVRAFPRLPEACAERLRALALATVLALEHAVEAAPEAAQNDAPQASDGTMGWAMGLHAGASVGELPTPAPVLGLELRVERGAWVPLELLALVDLRRSTSTLADAQLNTRQLTGSIGTCLGGSPSSWRIDGCLGIELGAVLGSAPRLPDGRSDVAGSGALALGGVARWSPRSHLALTARLEGFARFWVPRFQVLDAEGVSFAEQRLPLAGGRLRFGVSWLSK